MTNKTNVVKTSSGLSPIASAFYQYAGSRDSSLSFAKTILGLFPSGLDNLDDDKLEQIKRGCLLRHKENNPAKEYGYVEINGSKHFVEITSDMKTKPKETMRIDSDIALAYTAQAWGALKAEDKDKYDVIGIHRKAGQKYVSNTVNSARRDIKSLLATGTVSRKTPDDFDVYLKEVFDRMKARCKISADSRGDTTADTAKLDKAIKAFKVEYNK